MRLLPLLAALCAFPYTAHANPAFTGTDFSGIYDCNGNDSHEGEYTGTVTLELVRAQSTGRYGAYAFKLEVPGYGAYPGHAAARGREMAIHFANTDPATKDFGTGIAAFSKTKSGQWSFSKYYYEPEFKGGNYGTEVCVRR
ncbi:MAG TPA: hypothetical protein VFF03_18920 [Rhodocyclaceae bacterium]|nr:hypothetical protein [Rhodocyclaceae bacterium]